jgi:hypothetical protein
MIAFKAQRGVLAERSEGHGNGGRVCGKGSADNGGSLFTGLLFFLRQGICKCIITRS